jgi:hypothetical protein
MRAFHRWISILAASFALYLSVTGTLIQSIDLYTLASHAPANDPNLRGIRESINGPPNFEVIADQDYAAAALPAGLDLDTAMAAGMKSARGLLGTAPVRYIEVRMAGNRPIIQVRSPHELLAFDARDAQPLPGFSREQLDPLPAQTQSVPSTRTWVKGLHRMTAFGDWALWINLVVAISLCALILTGLVMYFRLLAARTRLRRPGPFWYAGDWWRTLHRCVAIVAAAFVIVATLSGFVLAIDSLGHGFFMAGLKAGGRAGSSKVRFADASSPLSGAELPTLLRTTLGAFRTSHADTPIKVIRLRYFAAMPQGVIIAGGDDTRQLVYNAASGREVSMTEPGYPETGQPFGWQEHQLMKQIHRGDWLGLPGRGMDLVAGLAIVFLSVSGGVMYVSAWNRRRRGGRAAFFWH